MGEDSVLLDSPLDKVEPYSLFKNTLLSKFSVTRQPAVYINVEDAGSLTVPPLSFSEMQQEQPQFYNNLAGHLSAEEQNVLQTIMAKADEMLADYESQLRLLQEQNARAATGAPAS